MAKLNFQPLFEYLDEKFANIDERFDEVNERISTITKAIDTCMKGVKKNSDEMLIINHRLGIHETRITATEEKLGIEFKH